MFKPLSARLRSTAFFAGILLISMVVRALLGVIHPHLSLEQTALVGITTVLLVGPTLHGWFFDAPFVAPKRRWHYLAISTCAVSMFLYFIALHA